MSVNALLHIGVEWRRKDSFERRKRERRKNDDDGNDVDKAEEEDEDEEEGEAKEKFSSVSMHSFIHWFDQCGN